MKYLIDTNIVIDYLKGDKAVVEKIKKLSGSGLVLSSISLAELYHGAEKSSVPKNNLSKINLFISIPEVSIEDFDEKSAREYGKLMSKLEVEGIKLAEVDTMIASAAKRGKYIVLTKDKKHFARLENFGIKLDIVS